ncbi:arylamine N-acetyltransferase [Halovenus rubra]|uniref:Arylamine N-acetyltransferase n=2 Tax=Halovenus rubra TaxID=869890 RepID=A0ACC7E1C9_9EURY|nr:arylamine N-acetyltransferase [Halovenus rubra]
MTPEQYLSRIGLSPSAVGESDIESLQRLLYAHVTAVPFENLAIVGDPHGDTDGSGVVLSTPQLYEKIVTRERGGYCFELNGLFHWLLDSLGYDVDRVAARITGDGGVELPANHHANVVHLDGRYVVDVGMGTPKIRQPIPVNGPALTDDVGVEWRVIEAERPDVTHRVEFRYESHEEWTDRYVFDETPRSLSYFEATNDYLQSAPESTFTGSPSISVGTENGLVYLDAETFVEYVGSEKHEEPVQPERWHDVLTERFGILYPAD